MQDISMRTVSRPINKGLESSSSSYDLCILTKIPLQACWIFTRIRHIQYGGPL